MAEGGEARIHHLNCGTMCPHGARLLQGEGGLLDRARLVCHCLAIESGDGLVLVDTGFGTEDVEHPRQLGRPFLALTSPRLRREDTALARLAELGFEAGDVRHIVVTHLDPDHSGGLPDFPEAEVHVFATEYAAAMNPKLSERSRYIGAHWSHEPRWVTHATAGDEWQGFESVRVLPGSDPEVLIVPLIGHSRGHSGVAVRDGEGWMLHCGDSYFFRGEIETPPRCPPGLRIFQTINQADGRARHENRERLRELARRGGEGLRLFCSHDPVQLERAQSAAAAN